MSMRSLKIWGCVLATCCLGLAIGIVGSPMIAQESGPDPLAKVEETPKCDPLVCYDVTIPVLEDKDIQVKILKTDGNCSEEKIISRVRGFIKGLGNGKPQKQPCEATPVDCACHQQLVVDPNGGTATQTFTDIDVALWGHCIVTVEVTITYKAGGTGYIGECKPKA